MTSVDTDPFSEPPSFSTQPSIGPVAAFWRFRRWTVPFALVIAGLAASAAYATSASSTATTTLFLTDPRGNPVFSNSSTNSDELARYARQRAEFAQSTNVLEVVVGRVNAEADGDPETLESLEDIVDASPTPTSDLRVDCTDTDADRAEAVCRVVADVYTELTADDTARQADEQIDVLLSERDRVTDSSSIAAIDGRIADIRREAVLFGGGVEFVEAARVEDDSRIAPVVQFGLAGLLFAVFAASAIAWFLAGRRPVIGSGLDATAALRAPLLGEVVGDPDRSFTPATPPGPAYQLLATTLGAVHPDGGVVLAGSATPNAHAAETVARMATASAREGRRVLVVDTDVDDRTVSRLFGVTTSSAGFAELLSGDSDFSHVQRSVGVGGDAWLDLVTGGRAFDDPFSLIRSPHGRDAIDALRSEYDLVLVAVAPLLTAPDSVALASAADGVVVMVDRGTATVDAESLRQRLEVLRTPVLGVVFDHRSGAHGR